MTEPGSYPDVFKSGELCVIIPTYNNAETLSRVIKDIAAYTPHIIVVNDGSSDNTSEVLDDFPFIKKISYSKNVGKGWALRKGFGAAIAGGYKYAITIDSDGQHFASDLPAFAEKLQVDGPAIIMGARNMKQESVPGKSSFGHKFSNFWFRVETGIKCPDTQTGYRLYPLFLMKNMKFFTVKYEFEIEALVRSAWKGIKIDWIPVRVYYAPGEERVSHFRPFKDFFRISILNTVLVLIAFLYIKPRDFFRYLFRKKNWRKELIEQLYNPSEAISVKAYSVGIGVFFGIVPIWGFQLLAAIAASVLLKLNKAIVIIAANISIPPMIPLIIFLSYKMGGLWMGKDAVSLILSGNIDLDTIRLNLKQYIYGSITLAVVAGIFFGLLTFVLLKIFKKEDKQMADAASE
jgi:glycosyltransferase involved in cell wall biosynthesis